MSEYRIRFGEFEGPLDLLLDLIEARKLSISTVSLADITDDYVRYLKSLTNYPKGEVADFLVIASTLMLIKSRALLPTIELSQEEEEGIYDLESRLKLLARIRELSSNIKESWGASPMFAREAFQGIDFGFIEPNGISIETLRASIENLVNAFPKLKELPEKTLEKVISIEEKMLELVSRFSLRLKASFGELVSSKDKIDVIIGFLALLELVKEGAFLVSQEERFGEINLEKNS